MKRATLIIVLAAAAVIPLIIVPDATDAFRLPKELVLRAEAILLLAAFFIAGRGPRLRRDQWLLPVIAFAILILLTITSTKPTISAGALSTAAATLIVFFATIVAAEDDLRSLLIFVPLGAALLNAVLVVLEELHVWMPFGEQPGVSHHYQCTALIGNPNEIGSYLGAATLAALAVRQRSIAIALAIGLIASQTLTALVAFCVAALVMLALSSLRNAIRVAAAAIIAAILVLTLVAPFRTRVINMVTWIRTDDYNALLTERLTPFVAAWSMFTDHPLTGVGPGTFAWHYFDYKLRAEVRHPALRYAYNRGVNYGEVHNDHLQVLAEDGLIGYATFAILLGALGAISFKTTNLFARRLALPLALFWFILSLAQFPLETTVVRSLLIHFAALCVAWREP